MKIIFAFFLFAFTANAQFEEGQLLPNDESKLDILLNVESEAFDKPFELEVLDSKPQFVFTSMVNSKRTRKLRNGSKTVVWTSDSMKIKGRIYIVNSHSVRIDSTVLGLNEILSMTKPNIGTKIAGTLIGGFFTGVGVALIAQFGLNSEGLSYAGVAAGFAVPFYSMNFIRRKFNLVDRWKVEVKYVVK